MDIVKYGLTKARTTLVGFFVLLLAGVVNYSSIPREQFPDVTIPVFYIVLKLDGISPEDSDKMLLRPLEDRLRSVEGLKQMKSNAYEGGGSIILEFDAGHDTQEAFDDIQKKVDEAKNDLPEDAKEPKIHEINLSLFPVVTIVFSGPYDIRGLTKIVDEIRDDIITVPSVLEVKVIGKRTEQYELIIDPVVLESYGLSTEQILRQLHSYNKLVTAGSLESESGKFAIKLPGIIEKYSDINSIPLIANSEGTIRVGDIADIRKTYKAAKAISRSNGSPSITLEIVKRTGENTIQTVDKVKEIVIERSKKYSGNLKYIFTQDSAKDIRNKLQNLTNSVITALVLVMIIVLGSLGIRSGVLVSMSIPATLMIGLLILNTIGWTLNTIVLFAIVLAVGMMVDATVVTVEFANRRLSEGSSPSQAYSEASKRMALPILSSTVTTLAAFLPLLFMPGIVGKVMQYLPITLMIMLLTSLVIALVFVPILGVYFSTVSIFILTLFGGIITGVVVSDFMQFMGLPTGLGNFIAIILGAVGAWAIWKISYNVAVKYDPYFGKVDGAGVAGISDVGESTIIDEAKLSRITYKYLQIVKLSLRYPKTTLIMTFSLLFITLAVYAVFNKGSHFFPNIESDIATVSIKSIGNFSLQERSDIVKEAEKLIFELKEKYGEIEVVQAKISDSRDDEKGTIGSISLDLISWNKRRSTETILQEIRYKLTSIAGIEVSTKSPKSGPARAKAVEIDVLGDSYDEVAEAARQVIKVMESKKEILNLNDSLSVPGLEWVLKVDREAAAKNNISISQIGSYVRMVTSGYKLTSFRPKDSNDEVDIITRFSEKYRNLAQLEQIRINTENGAIPITEVVTRIAKPQSHQLNRLDAHPVVTIQADVKAGKQASAVIAELKNEFEALDLNPNVKILFAGNQESSNESKVFLLQAFMFSFFLIFIILLAQFNSFMHCVIITSAIIISTSGVFIGHLIMNEPFGIIMSGIGVVSLTGIVVNNNIVLIDTFDQLRKRVSDPIQAILLTCVYRFRPVMLTSITTILGVLPTMFEVNIDFTNHLLSVGSPSMALWRQISISIVYGMTIATILTLVVTPTALAVTAARKGTQIRRKFRFSNRLVRSIS